MVHFVTFPNTLTCEQETKMAVASMMTCKICFILRHMKTPYSLLAPLKLAWFQTVMNQANLHSFNGANSCQIWCVRVFIMFYWNKHGHENAEMQKQKFDDVTLPNPIWFWKWHSHYKFCSWNTFFYKFYISINNLLVNLG